MHGCRTRLPAIAPQPPPHATLPVLPHPNSQVCLVRSWRQRCPCCTSSSSRARPPISPRCAGRVCMPTLHVCIAWVHAKRSGRLRCLVWLSWLVLQSLRRSCSPAFGCNPCHAASCSCDLAGACWTSNCDFLTKAGRRLGCSMPSPNVRPLCLACAGACWTTTITLARRRRGAPAWSCVSGWAGPPVAGSELCTCTPEPGPRPAALLRHESWTRVVRWHP